MRCWALPRRSAAPRSLVGPATAEFPFVDLASSERWTLRINDGLPWWIFDKSRRVPGTTARRLSAARAPAAGRRPTLRLATCIDCSGPLYDRLVHPLLLAALNIEPREGSAALASAVVRETLATGGKACRPLIARDGLGPAFIEPAMKHLQERNVEVRLEHELRALRFAGGRVAALDFGTETVDARRRRCGHPGGADAMPRRRWCPDLTVPQGHRAIANAHFRIDVPPGVPPMHGHHQRARPSGFSRSTGRLSVTISNADRLMDVPRAMLAQTIWQEVSPGRGNCRRTAAVADRARAARDLRGDAGGERQASAGARRNGTISFWPETGPRPDCRRRLESAVRSGNRAAERRRWREARHDGGPGESRPQHRRRRRGRCSIARSPTANGASSSRPTATIPAEYVLLRHYLGEPVDAELERKIAVYLRRMQGEHGGWPLFHDGDVRHEREREGLFRAEDDRRCHRRAAHGAGARGDPLARRRGARQRLHQAACWRCSASFPWRAVPVMPVEIMLLPKWFPFHLDKISYWSRTVIVPLLVLMALKPRARNPKNIRIDELFLDPPATLGPAPKAPQQKAVLVLVLPCRRQCAALRPSRCFPKGPRQRAIDARGGLGRRAAQRRGRARRDLSGDGQQRDDVRRAGLSAGPSAAGDRAALDREAAGRASATRPIASLASRRSGTPGLPRHALLETGDDEAQRRVAKGAAMARAEAGARRARATGSRGGRMCAPAAGRSNTPIRIIPTSTTPRWWRWRWIARRALDAEDRSPRGDRARAGMDPGSAEQERRLGRVRRRQRILLSQQHSVRRPRRAARSADRGRHRALRVDAGAARRDAGELARGVGRRSTISSARSLPTEAGTAAGA